MSDIDWSKAPEGATHFNPKAETLLWYRFQDGCWEFFNECGEWEVSSAYQCAIKGFIARPTQWTGEGLPPVGTVCEFKSVGHHSDLEYQWCIYHGRMSCGGYIVEYHHQTSPDMTTCAPFDPGLTYFRPIRTPEQIAADDREAAVQAAIEATYTLGISDVSKRILIERLYDAGYRKV